MADKELLIAVDGHSMAFRAFYALPPDMAAKDGTPTNAVFGFFSMLTNLVAKYKPTHLVVAFDSPGPTFRTKMDEQYKAQRGETPELFIPQTAIIQEMLDAMNIVHVAQDTIEADDIIGTYAKQAVEQKMDVIAITGDRDYFQMVKDPHVQVLYVRRGVSDTVLYDEAGILERTGIRADQYVDYSAMRGDTSDNLPGVSGVGEKTASKLLQEYENLEGIYENVEKLKPKQIENFGIYKDRVYLNREIMTLKCDVEEIPPIKDFLRVNGSVKTINELCEKLKFNTLSRKILTTCAITEPDEDEVVEEIKDEPLDLKEVTVSNFCKIISLSKTKIGIYLPSTKPDQFVEGFPDSIKIYGEFDTKHIYCNAKVDNELQEVLLSLEKNANNIVGYDVKSWSSYFRYFDMDLPIFDDVMIKASLEDNSRGKKNYIQTLATYLGVYVEAEKELQLELGAEQDSSDDIIVITNVKHIVKLDEELDLRLKDKEIVSVYEDIEKPLISILGKLETNGICVDEKLLDKIGKDIKGKCEKYRQEIFGYAQEEFNVNSTLQLRKILFEKLGLTPQKKTKTGASTDAATLNALKDDHAIVPAILSYREVEKLRSTYIEGLKPLIAKDERIHGSFHQNQAATGRFTSSDPNLQNIPIRSDLGKTLRTMFVAPKGNVLVSIDYSQIELRILAHLAQEKTLIEGFKNGDDVHALTAAKLFGKNLEEVNSDDRRFAKTINYGIAYGMESYGLSQRLEIEPSEAKQILEDYWKNFSNIKNYLNSVIKEAQTYGYTQTLFGRRRYFPGISSSNGRVRMAEERAATNAPVQGSAADIFKLSMIAVANEIEQYGKDVAMILTVHDELVFEVKADIVDDVTKKIVEVMENVVKLDVPLTVDVGVGPNWAEAK